MKPIYMYICLRRLPVKPIYTYFCSGQLSYGARSIFRSGTNIWFLEPPESRFEAFLAPGPKPLPERLIFIARDPFFGLDRISGF